MRRLDTVLLDDDESWAERGIMTRRRGQKEAETLAAGLGISDRQAGPGNGGAMETLAPRPRVGPSPKDPPVSPARDMQGRDRPRPAHQGRRDAAGPASC